MTEIYAQLVRYDSEAWSRALDAVATAVGDTMVTGNIAMLASNGA